jgi:hypothetical protein
MNHILVSHRKRHRGAVWMALLLSGMFFGLAPSARSQNPPKSTGAPNGALDLSGVWDIPGSAKDPVSSGVGDLKETFVTQEEPSMTPWGMEQFKKNRQGVMNPKARRGSSMVDPEEYCLPIGPSRSIASPGGRTFELRQLPGEVLILSEKGSIRRIYTDGRGHPEGYPVTWMGHSIGKWDGDTFVADTVYINPVSWADNFGHPMSDQMHITERFHRVKHDTLEIETTFDDPKAYTKPWKQKIIFELMPQSYEIMEYITCQEWLEKRYKERQRVPRPEDY